MAATWKKVLTEGSTVTVPNGGTGLTSITDGAVVIGNAQDPVQTVTLDDNQILIGTGSSSNPVARSAHSTSDVKILDDGTTYGATIQPGAVVGSMVFDNTLDWVTHESTGTPFTVPYYAHSTGAATVTSAPSSDGDVLTYDTSTNTLKWEAAGTASSLNINDQTNANNTVGYLGFATATSGGTDFKIDQGLKYNTDVNSNDQISTLSIRGGDNDLTDGFGIFISAAESAAGAANNYIKATNFIGYSTATKMLELTSGSVAGASYEIPLISNTQDDIHFVTGRKVFNNGGVKVDIDSGGVATLVIPNLTVTGTTTSVNTTTLDVEDHSLRISVPDVSGSETLTDNTAVAQGELGIIVGFNENNDTHMPRIVYKGYEDTVSVLGWRIAKPSSNDATSATTAYGVSVMHIDDGTMTTGGGDDSLDIGIGALATDANGDLWLQTAV